MKKIILLIASIVTLASCGQQTQYTTSVYYAVNDAGHWVDTSYRQAILTVHNYQVGDTLKGVYCDQIVIYKEVN